MQGANEKEKVIEHLLYIYKNTVGLDLFTSKQNFINVQNRLRELFNQPDLIIGISVFFQKADKKNELVRLMTLDKIHKNNDVKSIYRDAIHYSNKHYEQSIYAMSISDEYRIVEDFTQLTKSGIDYWLMRKGVRGMILSPLKKGEIVLGFLELTSTNKLVKSQINIEYLQALIPVFTNAVDNFRQALKMELHSLIRKHFTAIHPTVEWIFEDLAVEWLKEESDIAAIEAPILLEKIYCLYGVSDIRGSSVLRRNAIQEDLKTQVELAKKILKISYEINPLDHFQYLIFTLDKFSMTLNENIKVSDENAAINFLRREVEVLFNQVKAFSKDLKELCEFYEENLSETGAFYKKRREFETSVHLLNLVLNRFIGEQQEGIQKIYSHFFEKHITDGIEHSIFVGSAIDFSKRFNNFYLKSLKIWQLKLLCQCAILGERVKRYLSLPLDLAHLVVSQSEPVTIYFDFQEKKFKVEGTYNIRFEIMKKRIDKALIKGTNERLTQPGTVAVVYTFDADREEYMGYFNFLLNLGYIKSNCADYVLEDMQGIQGLRALRADIDIEKLSQIMDIDILLEKQYGLKK